MWYPLENEGCVFYPFCHSRVDRLSAFTHSWGLYGRCDRKQLNAGYLDNGYIPGARLKQQKEQKDEELPGELSRLENGAYGSLANDDQQVARQKKDTFDGPGFTMAQNPGRDSLWPGDVRNIEGKRWEVSQASSFTLIKVAFSYLTPYFRMQWPQNTS